MNMLGLFAKTSDAREFPSGTTIFEEGAPGHEMFVVLEGEVEVRVGSTPIFVVQPGDIVGEMALIDKQPRSATAIAKTNCRLAAVDERRFLFMVQETPFFALSV